jgi:hypothetical protein
VKLDEVAALAEALPEVTVGEKWGRRTWMVAGKGFAWERPFSKADIKRSGAETPPDGDIVALTVADLDEKDAVLQAGHKGVFTIEHFNGYAAVLVQLKAVSKKVFRELLEDAWSAAAPDRLAR